MSEGLKKTLGPLLDFCEVSEQPEGTVIKLKKRMEHQSFMNLFNEVVDKLGGDYQSTPTPHFTVPHAEEESAKEEHAVISIDSIIFPSFLPMRTFTPERLERMKESIRRRGLKYPIKVRLKDDKYELIDGMLRLTSVRQLGWTHIPVEIQKASDEEVVVDSIITNMHRVEEDPITLARKLNTLTSVFGYTQEKLAQEIGMSRPWIADTIRFLKLPEEVQNCLSIDSFGRLHAIMLLKLDDQELQKRLAKEIVDKGLSAKQLEARIHLESVLLTAPPEVKAKVAEVAEKQEWSPYEAEEHIKVLNGAPPELRRKVIDTVDEERLSPIDSERLVKMVSVDKVSTEKAITAVQEDTKMRVEEAKRKEAALYGKLTRYYPTGMVEEVSKIVGDASEEKFFKFFNRVLEAVWRKLSELGLSAQILTEAGKEAS